MMPRCFVNSSLLVAAVLVALTGYARGQDDEDAVEAARSSLRESNSYPWYDAEKDEVRRIDVSAKKKVEEKPAEAPAASRTATAGSSATSYGQFFAALITILFWIMIAVILGFVIGLVIWVFIKMETRQANQSESTLVADSSGEVDRVENLPFAIKRPQDDLLAAARQCYEAGNLRDAIIYLFSYQLVHLDRNQLIHLAKGKTNRQYLFELRRNSLLVRLLEGTMVAFEDVFFGDHNLPPRDFEHCWRRLDEFHDLVGQGAGG